MRNEDITGLLRAWRDGRIGAVQALTRQTLDELRRIAGMSMRDQRPVHTLEPSARRSRIERSLVEEDRLRGRSSPGEVEPIPHPLDRCGIGILSTLPGGPRCS